MKRTITPDIRVPAKLADVFIGPARYRGSYGGRGSAKTRTFAKMSAIRAALLAQAGVHGIILCGREYMNSLDESSMAEVKNAIREEPWLESLFDIGEKYIRTKCKSVEYKFAGLRHNLDSIKSKSRILILWVDEAEPVSDVAWRKIIPTVREENSEIWVTWNPEVENSATDRRFRKQPPPGAKIVEMNYTDNPWFPEVLRQEMEWDRERDPDKFEHIWGGGYDTKSETRVFRNWKKQYFDTPDDVDRFLFGGDWGYAVDPAVLVRAFIDEPSRKLYVDHEAYKIGCEIEETPALYAGDCPFDLNDAKYWTNEHKHSGVEGSLYWPIVADSARPETISYVKRRGFNIRPARKGANSVMDGISFLKNYDIIVHPRCVHTIDELKNYRWKTDARTEEIIPVPLDKKNHVIDSLRYAVESERRAKRKALDMTGGSQDNWAKVG